MKRFVEVFFDRFDGDIVHEFDARRRNAGLDELGDDAHSLAAVVKDGQEVEVIFRLGDQF
mgnify:CR=1 FL=1